MIPTTAAPFTAFLSNTTLTSTTFNGQIGHTYGFYSVATDNLGNVQPTPSGAQATTTIDGPPTSTVAPLPAVITTASFTVSWSGTPGHGGHQHQLVRSLRLEGRRDIHSISDRHQLDVGELHRSPWPHLRLLQRGDRTIWAWSNRRRRPPRPRRRSSACPPARSARCRRQPATTSFTVSWSGTPGPGASSIASYTIFDSKDGGPFAAFLSNTSTTSTTFTGRPATPTDSTASRPTTSVTCSRPRVPLRPPQSSPAYQRARSAACRR